MRGKSKSRYESIFILPLVLKVLSCATCYERSPRLRSFATSYELHFAHKRKRFYLFVWTKWLVRIISVFFKFGINTTKLISFTLSSLNLTKEDFNNNLNFTRLGTFLYDSIIPSQLNTVKSIRNIYFPC